MTYEPAYQSINRYRRFHDDTAAWLNRLMVRFMVAMLLLLIAATLYAATQPVDRITVPALRLEWPAPVSVHELLVYAADRHGVPWQAAVALAEAESRGNPSAVRVEHNGTKSIGVMQLNTRWFKGAERMSVAENVEAGVGYLAVQRRKCFDVAAKSLGVDTALLGRATVQFGTDWLDPFLNGCAVDWYRGKRR